MIRVQYTVEPESEELVCALLWVAGCAGVSSGGEGVLAPAATGGGDPLAAPGLVSVEGYFEAAPDLSALELAGFRPSATSHQQPEDWLAAWRRAAEPILIGEHLQIEPGEPDLQPLDLELDGRRRILVPARAAFGTGSHETTRLMLDALDRDRPSGNRVLDVGCGSGILSFVSLALGARQAFGFELDLESALLAGINTRLNHMQTGLWAGSLDSLSARSRFDLVLVNVLPERILDRAGELAPLLAPTGRLWYAGHLLEREAETVACWSSAGLEVAGRAERGEWGLLELRWR